MESYVEQFEKFLSQLTSDGYIVIGVSTLLTLILVHTYSLIQGKKKLRQMINDNVKMFQQAFDIAEDGMLILSNKNKVIYANNPIVDMLGLEKDFLGKVLKRVPKIKLV
jgi:PAS domain-containing protein